MHHTGLLPAFDTDLPLLDDLPQLLVSGVPLMDTRAPVEFAAGAFPGATNLPLMNDTERARVGQCYKEAGQEAAIELGLQFVSGPLKKQRLANWADFVRRHPQGALYCFRGGLRSRIAQQWIYEHTGVRYPRIQGGYKAMRRYLLEQLETLPAHYQALILSGRTGSGKTRLLTTFKQHIDLEQLANHRGSAFGPQVTPQPTQIGFENALAIALLKQVTAGVNTLLFEDESKNIGSVHIPPALRDQLQQAGLVMLDTPDAERAEISYQEYVVDMVQAFTHHHNDPEQGFQAFSHYLLGSLDKIRRRLGGVRHQAVRRLMEDALTRQAKTGSTEQHRAWVRSILFDYYDPMYDYQIRNKQQRLLFRGEAQAVREYLAEQGVY